MRWDMAVWAVLALLLIAAETLVPGAFLLWMGIAAAAMCLLVLVLPDIALLWQIVASVLLSFLSVQVYRTWFAARAPERSPAAQSACRAVDRPLRAARSGHPRWLRPRQGR